MGQIFGRCCNTCLTECTTRYVVRASPTESACRQASPRDVSPSASPGRPGLLRLTGQFKRSSDGILRGTKNGTKPWRTLPRGLPGTSVTGAGGSYVGHQASDGVQMLY